MIEHNTNWPTPPLTQSPSPTLWRRVKRNTRYLLIGAGLGVIALVLLLSIAHWTQP